MIDGHFWSARPVLQHALTVARARRVGPGPFSATRWPAPSPRSPNITIPGLVGGRMSLNLFIASVGPSGSGKGAADAASAAGIHFGGSRTDQVPIGTGEGIARTFRPVGTKPDDANPITNVIFTCAEIDTWAALAARSGATFSRDPQALLRGTTRIRQRGQGHPCHR